MLYILRNYFVYIVDKSKIRLARKNHDVLKAIFKKDNYIIEF